MSKSLGNSPEPLELIKKYGADGVRVGMLFCSPAGGDLLFDESLTEQGRNFSIKIWNAFRLVKNWQVDAHLPQPEYARLALEWFDAKLANVIRDMDDLFAKFRISDALMLIYTTLRDDFSSWLLEAVKPAYQQPIDKTTLDKVTDLFDALMRILHPFMPFLTEEIWQMLTSREKGASIMVSSMPEPGRFDEQLLEGFADVQETITGLRNLRKTNNLPMKDPLVLKINAGSKGYTACFDPILTKLGNLEKIEQVQEDVKGAVSFRVKTSGFFIELGKKIDVEAELQKLEEELIYTRGFLDSVLKKLSNERFVNHAPQNVVDLERKKQADAEEKIKALEEQIAVLR